MMPQGNTGSIVPGWIREEIGRCEAAWPLWVLACGTGAVILAGTFLGACLWNPETIVIYARP